jgi:cytochrome c oxidase cbb3-type subunit 3
MMHQPASLFVIVFTAINIVACLWLMWWTAHTRTQHTSKDADSAAQLAVATGTEKTGHVWDGDLEELNNPLPRWWLGLFILTVLFGAAYLIFYPGLGNFAGTGRWSSVSAYDDQMKQQQQRFESRLAALRDKPLHELAGNPAAMSAARNLFGANCSTCHGSDARGANGFPNLTDSDWLWGGGEARVYESISQGRHGVMPALGTVLGSNGVNEVASYVLSLSGHKAPQDWISAGKDRFATICAACHGPDAKGNPALGAPNLTDGIWLHGGDFDTVHATIEKGRDSQMPAHAAILGDTKVRLLAAYVLSLSGNAHSDDSDDEDDDDEHHEDAVAAASAPLGDGTRASGHAGTH